MSLNYTINHLYNTVILSPNKQVLLVCLVNTIIILIYYYYYYYDRPAPDPLLLVKLAVDVSHKLNVRVVLVAGWSEIFTPRKQHKRLL